MGKIRAVPDVKFFTSIIFSENALDAAEPYVTRVLGPVEDRTDAFPFSQSDYYECEMGARLSRVFLLFQPLVQRERLVDVKLAANDIEQTLSSNGNRRVNIDPGYIALEHVILATTKGYSHRVYLGRGILADLTLIYAKGSYRPLEWTYPDYGGAELIGLFNGWRNRYKESLRWQRA